jgi:hypothetical protein
MTEVLTPTQFAGLKITKTGITAPKPGEVIPGLNILIYGEAGIGKTWLAGSAHEVPTMRNLMYVDAEAGRNTLDEYFPGITILNTNNWYQYEDIYNGLYAGGHDYRTVVLDSISEILEHCKEAVMEEMKTKPDNEDRDPDVPSVREWGIILTRMLRLVRRFKDLKLKGINVIFVAHAEQVKTKSGAIKWMPLVNGKFQMKLPQIPDMVGWVYMTSLADGEEPVRVMLTQQSDKAVAKTRGVKDMPRNVGVEEPLTMKTIMGYYERSRKPTETKEA